MEKQERGGRENATPATVISAVFDQLPLSLLMDLLQSQAPREEEEGAPELLYPSCLPSHAVRISLWPSPEKHHHLPCF